MGDIKLPKIETILEIKNETEEVAELYLYGYIRSAYPWDDEEDETLYPLIKLKMLLRVLKAKPSTSTLIPGR